MNDRTPQDEKALMAAVAQGDERAFRTIFDIYRNRLYFYILGITSSKEITEDIVQDTFLKIWLRREHLTEVLHFNAYLFRVAQNAVFTGLRRKATEAAIVKGKLEPAIAELNPDEKLHLKLVKETIQKAVDALPDQQRAVYRLRRNEGYHIKEIAKHMNLSEVTVKRHLGNAQKTLRAALEKSLTDPIGILLLIFGLTEL